MKLTKTVRENIVTKAVDYFLPNTHSPARWTMLADLYCVDHLRLKIDPDLIFFWDAHSDLHEYFQTADYVLVALSNKDKDGHYNWWENAIKATLTSPLPSTEVFRISREESVEISDRFKLEKQLADKEADGRNDLSIRIMSMLEACNTTKQVLEIMPELEPFMPPEATTKLVPVSVYENLKRDLHILAEVQETISSWKGATHE